MSRGIFGPENIDLTDEEFQYNYSAIENFNPQTAIRYQQNKPLMLAHCRGELLEASTRVALITDTNEKKVVATRLIPKGAILGAYFGELVSSLSELNSYERDISLIENVRDADLQVIEALKIVGILNGQQTRIATINHAYFANVIYNYYLFSSEDVKNAVATANLATIKMKLTLLLGEHPPQHIIMNVFIALNDIDADDVLLMCYEHQPSSSIASYWRSRNRIPLLFNKAGDYLPQHVYLPTTPFFPEPAVPPTKNTDAFATVLRFLGITAIVFTLAFYIKIHGFNKDLATAPTTQATTKVTTAE